MSLPFDSTKGQQSLRRGRQSLGGAIYFLTICTERRTRGLENAWVTVALPDQARQVEGHWQLCAAVVMPDHIHLLVELCASNDLSEAVRLFKGRYASVLRQHDIKWQRGYFDHRLRTNEDVLPIFQYIFLNPYRAGLIPTGRQWRGYFCSPDDWIWFEPLTDRSLPFPEWLKTHRGVKPLLHRNKSATHSFFPS